jgi:type II pantothenate kinase
MIEKTRTDLEGSSMIIAADLGGSATKLVLLSDSGEVVRSGCAAPERSAAALGEQVRRFLDGCGVNEGSTLVLTGVGSSFIGDAVPGFALQKVDEFAALSRGTLHLGGVKEAVAVSLGTGTAFVRVSVDGGYQHLGGSGVGGGTLLGLGKALLGASSVEELLALADTGSLKKVDWQMGDMALSSVSTLPPELTSSNFGKLSPDATPGDLALGLINLVLQSAGSLAMFAARTVPCDTILFAGALAELPQAAPTWQLFESVYPFTFRSLPHARFVTAIGAGLSVL